MIGPDYAIIIYNDEPKRDEVKLTGRRNRETHIRHARRLIAENPHILLIEVWGTWNVGNGERRIRLYSESQWQ